MAAAEPLGEPLPPWRAAHGALAEATDAEPRPSAARASRRRRRVFAKLAIESRRRLGRALAA